MLLNQTVDAQPCLGQLAADPSLRGLLGTLGLIAEGVQAGQANLEPFEPALHGFHAALSVAAATPSRCPGSGCWPGRWRTWPVADLAGHYRFVLTQPRQDYGALQPGAATAQAIRDAAAKLDAVRSGRAQGHERGADDPRQRGVTGCRGVLRGLRPRCIGGKRW